ncbi:MAG TPA: CocE/NonD family hydrolase [Polyangiaceae bacterium]|nr:MAG: Cocaine esterase [Deltaproteobacteria bacterium ADurb.Bin207]HNS95875.1 CocE/NonD family hydrolase [Polyangiaceae bacterium]HNZ24563.1 CocE/NonD family hydrolase [Polyangiaceae bacterium]HOD25562.1 CocE/NonD family hydrolase [Polyangiaceae bacterium]HOE47917.1 CocE/NonD family hydrolase [Polyangiaceae bacterium]
MRRLLPVCCALCCLAPAYAFANPSFTGPVTMRDGVALATDVYLPEGPGPFPVLVARTPYDKAGGQGIGDGLRDAGVVTVVQDTRGRFASQGVDCLFQCDGEDGFDTLAWVAAQPWCNGRVVTWGGSALGIVQYMAAVHAPPALDAMWVEVATPTVYQHAFFQNGAFRQSMMEGWLAGQHSDFFLDTLAEHPLDDGTWDSVQTADRYDQVIVPGVHYGGWYDIFNQGTIDAFVGYQHHGGPGAKGKQKLVMGPWTHALNTTQAGELTYPSNAAGVPGGTDTMLVTWLAHYLGFELSSAAVDAIPTVQYYVMGDVKDPSAPGNTWRSADDWPIPAAPVRMHLHPGGMLDESCPTVNDARTSYLYDPAFPSPTKGGANLLIPAGPVDQTIVENRSDVIVFSSAVLTKPMEITGRIRASLWVETDAVDTDINVRLTDVYPDGRSMLVLDGVQRLGYRNGSGSLEPVPIGQPIPVTVDLWSTSIILAAGHKLRVSITSSNAPRFWPNPNDGSTYRNTKSPTKANVSILHDQQHPSYVELPDPNRPDTDITVCDPHDAGAEASTDGSVTHDAPHAEDGAIETGVDASVDAPLLEDALDTKEGGSSSAATAEGDGGCGCRTKTGSSATPWLALAWLFLSVVNMRKYSRKHVFRQANPHVQS